LSFVLPKDIGKEVTVCRRIFTPNDGHATGRGRKIGTQGTPINCVHGV
jgi:hypothetical protein